MSNYPLIRFVIYFIVGLIIQSIFSFTLTIVLILSLLFFGTAILLHISNSEVTKQLKNIAFILTIIFFGSLYYKVTSIPKLHYPFPLEKYFNTKLIGTVNNIALKREGKIIIYVTTNSLLIKDFNSKGSYEILCSIYDTNGKISKLYDQLKIGNKIEFKGNLLRPRNQRNPGEYDYEKYLNSNGICAIANIYKTDDVNIISDEGSLKNIIHQIRKSIDEKITLLHNKTTSGLLRGLLLADRSAIEYETRNEFINAGVIHVLAVSGLHVGYIVLIFALLFNRLNIYTRLTLTVFGLIFFLIITGMPTSVFRAVVMATVLILGQILGRDYNGINSISLAAFVILLIKPDELFNAGFQLSFSAVLSIIIIYPYFSRIVNSWKIKKVVIRWILLFFSVSLAAQIGTLPFTLVYFNKLSIIALFANIIVIPLIGFIVGLGILSMFIGILITSLASIFASCNELLAYGLFSFVKIIGNTNISYLSINQFSIYDAVIFYLILVLIFFIIKNFTNRTAKIVGVTLSVMMWILFIRLDNYEMMPKNSFSVIQIDIGQGDAALIKFPNGKTALIDAGEATQYFDNGERVILPLMDKLGIDMIDYGFISHVDSDHYKGFLSIIGKQKVRQIFKPKLDPNSQKDIDLENYLTSNSVPFKYYSKEIIPIGNSRIYVLNDTANHYFESMSSNDQSGMLKLVYGNNSFLFTGDASTNVESEYVNNYKTFLRSDVLKAGHHGSRSGTSEEFLEYVEPNYAVISAGVMNKFNHPHKDIIERFNQNNINVVRTDKSGAIMFRSNGNKIEKINWKKMESTFNL